jgi:predicted aspartyl protease
MTPHRKAQREPFERGQSLTASWVRLHSKDMGRVVAKIKLTNYLDLELKRLKLRREKPRTVQTDALVDTGATRLYLKRSVIKALGLRKEGEVVSKTTNGTRRRSVYQAARLELMGRNGAFEVVEIDDDVPNLLGQIPLEYLDLVVDPKGQKLMPNPEHGDKQMSEEY